MKFPFRVGVLALAVAFSASGSEELGMSASASVAQAGGATIAFERSVGPTGVTEIHLMNTDGSDQRRLTSGCCFEWSPDGTKIAFYRPSGALWVIDADGSNSRRLAKGGAEGLNFLEPGLTWSPDGKQIAFVGPHTRLSDSAIYVVNPDGTGLARLSAPKNLAADSDPDWSPDGTQIVYSRDGSTVIVMNADASAQRVLSRGELEGWSPVWSPDGARIAFEGTERLRQFDLYVMQRDGSGRRNLTNTRSPNESDPRWSPDGRSVAFVSLRHPDPDIHLIRADGTRHVNLARSPKYDAEPDWSPDGASIVFASTRDGNRDIYVMTATGGNQTNLTNGPVGTRYSEPAFSP